MADLLGGFILCMYLRLVSAVLYIQFKLSFKPFTLCRCSLRVPALLRFRHTAVTGLHSLDCGQLWVGVVLLSEHSGVWPARPHFPVSTLAATCNADHGFSSSCFVAVSSNLTAIGTLVLPSQ